MSSGLVLGGSCKKWFEGRGNEAVVADQVRVWKSVFLKKMILILRNETVLSFGRSIYHISQGEKYRFSYTCPFWN